MFDTGGSTFYLTVSYVKISNWLFGCDSMARVDVTDAFSQIHFHPFKCSRLDSVEFSHAPSSHSTSRHWVATRKSSSVGSVCFRKTFSLLIETESRHSMTRNRAERRIRTANPRISSCVAWWSQRDRLLQHCLVGAIPESTAAMMRRWAGRLVWRKPVSIRRNMHSV